MVIWVKEMTKREINRFIKILRLKLGRVGKKVDGAGVVG